MPYPSETLYPSESLFPGAGGESISRVRESAPLRLSIDVEAPTGRHHRWAPDTANAYEAPSSISFSTTIPGGFEQMNVTLKRRPGEDYGDLNSFSNVRVLGAGAELAWEGRIEGAPRSSGEDMNVVPNAVGWQAALEDDQTAVMPYVDRDLSHWGDATSARKLALYDVFSGLLYNVFSPGSTDAGDDGAGALRLNLDARASVGEVSELWYDSHSSLSSVYFAYSGRNLASGDVGAINASNDTTTTGASGTDVVTGATPSGTRTETAVSTYRYAVASLGRAAGTITSDADRPFYLSDVAVYGNHGLTKRGTEPEAGFYASDVIDHAVGTWASSLSRRIDNSGFVIPHIAFLDYTTAAEIVRQANRFHLWDWGVWDNKTFHYYEQGRRGRTWRARIGPTNLQEAGPQMDRIWNGVVVSYPDVDGSTRTVGPPGSGADTEDSNLLDSDSDNPANQAGLRRWTKLDSSTVTTSAGAIEIGRRFLLQSAQINTSGQATIVGVCTDDRGVSRPAWQVRAGDYIRFADAADTSPRRIVRTSYDADTLTNSIDLDSPPEGLDALLERLSVVLVGLNY